MVELSASSSHPSTENTGEWLPKIIFKCNFRFGTLYLSCNFACFSSHVPGLVNLVLPLKVAFFSCCILSCSSLFFWARYVFFSGCQEYSKDWIKCWILSSNSELPNQDLWIRTSTSSTQIPLSGCQLYWKVCNKCQQWGQRWSNCVHNASWGKDFHFWPGSCSLLQLSYHNYWRYQKSQFRLCQQTFSYLYLPIFHDIWIFTWHCLKVSDRDFVVEKLCELLSRLSGLGEDSTSITSSGSSTAFSIGWVQFLNMA